MPVLVGWDLIGIQEFVYSSNRLRDVVGASMLVGDACRMLDRGHRLSSTGGVAIHVYDSMLEAAAAIAKASRRLLTETPGLDVAVAALEFSPGDLAQTFNGLGQALEESKLSRRVSAPLGGLGVTVPCSATGRPATDTHADGSGKPGAVSASIAAARRRFYTAEHELEFLSGNRFVFPVELDDLGGTPGERSMLAIVHLDGDGIGAKIDAWRQHHADANSTDDEFAKDFIAWSEALDEAGRKTFQAVVGRVLERIGPDVAKVPKVGADDDPVAFELSVGERDDRKGRINLPLRLILLGGDDLTFVCDARIGLELARVACEAFEHNAAGHRLGALTASAGVALVPSHTPFVRAYDLAESLCRSAKTVREEANWGGGAVDWHLGAEVPGSMVREMRMRDLAVTPGTGRIVGTLRPYSTRMTDRKTTIGWLLDDLLGDGDTGLRGVYWSKARSKVRSLADSVLMGPDAIQPRLDAWRTVEPNLGFPSPLNDAGYWGNATPLIDAEELLDRSLSKLRDAP